MSIYQASALIYLGAAVFFVVVAWPRLARRLHVRAERRDREHADAEWFEGELARWRRKQVAR